MEPTKEQIEAAKKWVLENIDNAYGFEGTAEHVWLSGWLAEYAALRAAEKDRALSIIADPENYVFEYGTNGAMTRIWIGEGDFAEIARTALESNP